MFSWIKPILVHFMGCPQFLVLVFELNCVQIQPFADILPGRLASHLEATSPAIAASAYEVLQQVKKAAPGTMHKVENLMFL